MSEDWAKDMVVTELRRSYPSGLAKGTLEERTGVGPGELRDVITELEEEGAISEAEDGDGLAGWRWLEAEERVIGQGAVEVPGGDVDPEGEEDSGEPLEGPETAEGAAQELSGRVVDTPYRASIVLEVLFHPEPQEGEGDDEAAVRESREIMEHAAEGILTRFPSLSPSASVALVAFDNPRPVRP